MDFLPLVTKAEYRGDFKIHLAFNDGTEAVVDFADWLEGAIFDPVKDPRFFQRFFVEAGAVVWPNGADIAPETLYERAKSIAAA